MYSTEPIPPYFCVQLVTHIDDSRSCSPNVDPRFFALQILCLITTGTRKDISWLLALPASFASSAPLMVTASSSVSRVPTVED
jgi:hypothetical protein